MTDNKPKWNRRKEARPTEIIEAAMHVFIEHGFAATKLTDVASRAGIVKGTLYRYYETKEDLFRAVVQHAVSVNLQEIENAAKALRGSFVELVPDLLGRAAEKMSQSHIPALALLVISESHSFPDLAGIWHDNVVAKVLSMLTDLITEAQKRGEIRPGDPKAFAFSIVGPMVMAVLFQEVLGTGSNHLPDLATLAKQHAETILRGIIVTEV
ncbi:TetR/AcrR family transcriptional regulator [Dyadobacter chenhuakuii]|uniref:TetR/AcrR family transcriptional regulator n=1 Tax=Dyadobacter chenhuakuii TaxID=2909339 RepID=A0A9X1U3P6_9BACT|nr:TetR/AcrR family transcriptional regulator [Dyadobacter chenhuakuii]MCF2493455.1 TetR/AcrR family transcriptional regulator [Dyadobacter chenhuakuii]MCF2501701.1 TetR/AcrR family transcriptional regulator [Dyadobacter chenhuakuii]USJ30596.1 TetR/AcrR family transcriptional regulator [Dyadobacter chenhuakuii]